MIYLDNAATTRTEPEVVEAMLPYMTEYYGNPSANYKLADESLEAVENARKIIADFIGADSSEIIFTSGGTEADNMAIKSRMGNSFGCVRTSTIEHKAILNSISHVNALPSLLVDKNGVVRLDGFAFGGMNDLISVMFANNEIGTIQPVKKIADICHETGAKFHTDAVQAFGHIPINVKELGIDMMSASGHKMGAPKGIGFLYVSKGISIPPFIHGGGQENGMRSGTENVPAIVGLAKAVEIAKEKMADRYHKTETLRDFFESWIMWKIKGAKINGFDADRLPGHSNITFPGIRAEEMLEYLNMYDICASSGSACNSSDERPSHVLKAIGLTDDEANATLRFTMNHENTVDEMKFTIDKIIEFLTIKGIVIQ